MRGLVLLLLALGAFYPRAARAVQLDELDLAQRWQLRHLRFVGNDHVKDSVLKAAMVTKPRPWFAFWREYPEFDPVAFRIDLERVARVYRNRGYYEARILHDIELPAEGLAVTAILWIEEGPAVHVGHVDVDLGGDPITPEERTKLLATFPVKEGEVFTQDLYDQGLANLRGYYRQNGFARVTVTKSAKVDLADHLAAVTYRVGSGPPSVFGDVEVSGNKDVSEKVIRREIAFAKGEPFKQSLLDDTRDQLTALNLFSSVRLEEDEGFDPEVNYKLKVTELPPREIRLGVGYDTEEQVRGLASWRNYNFLGGARQLGFAARASFITRTLLADFLQPHYPTHFTRTRVLFAETQDDEDAYTLLRTRVSPRLEWQPTRRFTAYVFHRSEFDNLSDVNADIKRAIPGIAPNDAFLSGFGIGFDWIRTDDMFDPRRGFVLKAGFEPVGGPFGGDVSFIRLVGEIRGYHELVGKLLGSVRLRLGAAQPIAGDPEIPIYERFYAGGINSVRGYGRWRVGPLIDDEPVGGRTLVETSVELRHRLPFTDTIDGVVFLDSGQVSLDSWDFPFDDLQYGTGLGVRVKTPIGPLGVDFGVPIDPPPEDQPWQITVSLGAPF